MHWEPVSLGKRRLPRVDRIFTGHASLAHFIKRPEKQLVWSYTQGCVNCWAKVCCGEKRDWNRVWIVVPGSFLSLELHFQHILHSFWRSTDWKGSQMGGSKARWRTVLHVSVNHQDNTFITYRF